MSSAREETESANFAVCWSCSEGGDVDVRVEDGEKVSPVEKARFFMQV